MVIAELKIYSSRESPLKSGYRPLFLIKNNYYSGIIYFNSQDYNQKEIVNVKIDFLTYNGQICEGEIIKFFESPENEIGEIKIISVCKSEKSSSSDYTF
jgi:hypothetical protein